MMSDGVESTSTARRDGGFTLVELLIVISILGILATVTVFSVRGISDRGSRSRCMADRKVLQIAVETYFANTGATAIPATGTGDNQYEQTLVAAGLIRQVSPEHIVLVDGAVDPVVGSVCAARSGVTVVPSPTP